MAQCALGKAVVSSQFYSVSQQEQSKSNEQYYNLSRGCLIDLYVSQLRDQISKQQSSNLRQGETVGSSGHGLWKPQAYYKTSGACDYWLRNTIE